jgi:hypothetical protein
VRPRGIVDAVVTVRSFLQRLLGGSGPETPAAVQRPAPGPEGEGIGFRELVGQLRSADPEVRARSAMLLSALGGRGAIRPLVRSYVHYGDRAVLQAAGAFGQRLTPVVAREARDRSLADSHRARLMELLAAADDAAALPTLRAVAAEWSPVTHVAACAALARLGDASGIERLAEDLLSPDAGLRRLALGAIERSDHPLARAAAEAHVRRYLGAGGAVPAHVAVSLPLLIRPPADLVDLLADHVRRSARTLTVVTGPASAEPAETERERLARGLPGHRLFFTTERHSPDEQLAVLAAARDAAASGAGQPVVLFGPLPSPEGRHPLPHFLTERGGAPYDARIVFTGTQKFAIVMEWARYVEDRAEVPAELEVVVTALVLGETRMTEEETAIYRLAGEERRDAFARAFLARLEGER